MLKKLLSIVIATALSILLVACNTNTSKESSTGNDKKQEENITDTKNNNTVNSKGKVYEVDGIFTDNSGIIQSIKEVSIFNNMTDAIESYGQSNLVINDQNKNKVTVVIKFEIKNNNDFVIYTYPTQAKFITNTGEQVNADLWASESFDGEIYEGVTKEGHILFNLDKTTIDELTSFKMFWTTSHENGTSDNYEDDYYMDNKLEVTLK